MKKYLLALLIMTACVLSPLSDARATILFAGGEDSDFTAGAGVSLAVGPYYYSAYAREGIFTSGTTTEPPTNYELSPTFTASSTIWVHATIDPNNADITNSEVLRVLSPDGLARILIRATGTVGQYKISTINAAYTITDLVTMSSACFPTGALRMLDLYINYGTSGEVTLYCNGVSYADYTGNVTTNSATQLNQISLGGVNGGQSILWSEIIVATTDTRTMRLVTLAPAANGNTHNFDTGAASNVNETTLSNATVDASGTAGQIQEYTIGALPAGTWSVLDLWLNARAEVDTTGPQHLQGMVRTSSTDYTSSNLAPPQGSFGWISTDWTTNPNTGVAWTTGDLGAAGFNIGYKSAN
jgi:hypothetical protein